jgi:cAMP phosphodiesterase
MQGSGGGPIESNCSAFLVRSTTAGWKRGSVLAVDAGTHLAAISRILEPYIPDAHSDAPLLPMKLTAGPFKGLELPSVSAGANAAYVTRFLVDTFLITHPHLDHISGFVINTAGLPGSRPKRLAGLPNTISAFKAHIFNNVIWPNLSDENNGAGLVTYMRLVDGGSPAIGDGNGKGYVEISEGLSVKTWSISHGHCIEKHTHRGSNAGLHPFDHISPHHDGFTPRASLSGHGGVARLGMPPDQYDRRDPHEQVCVYDSSAYFIRDIATGREVLIFGDVEPDSISLSPRNLQVWTDAAPKVVAGILKGIFIECSYDDSQADDQLYGHLTPRYLIEEMRSLATCVDSVKQGERESRKRKRPSHPAAQELEVGGKRTPGSVVPRARHESNPSPCSYGPRSLELDGTRPESPLSPMTPLTGAAWSRAAYRQRSLSGTRSPAEMELNESSSSTASDISQKPLKGLKIVIIHIKDKLADGPSAAENVIAQIKAYEEEEKLGCEFLLAEAGMSVYL